MSICFSAALDKLSSSFFLIKMLELIHFMQPLQLISESLYFKVSNFGEDTWKPLIMI